jgi:hypothetical protein
LSGLLSLLCSILLDRLSDCLELDSESSVATKLAHCCSPPFWAEYTGSNSGSTDLFFLQSFKRQEAYPPEPSMVFYANQG